MSTERTVDLGGDTVEITRAALHGTRLAPAGEPSLTRGEAADDPDDTRIEVPIPLSRIRSLESVRVLHVDDDPEITDLTGTLLERINDNFTIVTEQSAVAALDRLDDEPIDCIVSDYQMPNMDGLEFLEVVREQYPDLPFILFTGRGSEAIASDAIAAGVTDYMQKGTGTDQYEVLANRIENAVEQYHTRKQFWNTLSWYQRLVEQQLAGVCIVQDGAFVYANRRFAEMFGYEQEEMIDRSPAFIDAEAEFDRLAERNRSADTADSVEFTFTGERAAGEPITVETSAGSIEYQGEPAWICVVCDADEGSRSE